MENVQIVYNFTGCLKSQTPPTITQERFQIWSAVKALFFVIEDLRCAFKENLLKPLSYFTETGPEISEL